MAAQHLDDGDEADDIEAYMEQWLRRVRGQTDEPSSGASGAATNAARATAAASTIGNPTVPRTITLQDLAPAAALVSSRSGKLERPAELKALREVANVSARSAINGSLRKQFLGEFQAKATVSGVALAMAGVLYVLSPERISVLALGAAGCALISVVWGLRIVGDFVRMRRQRSHG